VVRKGSCAEQELPASTDAFVWLRLYQVEMDELIPQGRRLPLWWTLRRPIRPGEAVWARLTGAPFAPERPGHRHPGAHKIGVRLLFGLA
jgi:hypothetical protein